MSAREDFLQESNPQLVAIIRDEIERLGPVRFDRFMELALYHPEHGYYQVAEAAPGRTGDFITAPEAHPIFGATLAAQIVDFDELLHYPDEFALLEYGAGSGLLIRPLLAELRQKYPDLYQRVQYTPIELNRTRRAELERHLADGGHAERLRTELPETDLTGCVLANEFLDAFPVRRFLQVDASMQEVFVEWNDGWFSEITQPVDDPAIREYTQRHHFSLDDGEFLEFHPGIEEWTEAISQRLTRGFALIIDYGYPADQLFTEHRRAGTVKAYYQHGVSTEIYRGIGKQDLTAHVNFSEVEWHAERSGLSKLGLTTQADLLAALGIGERLVQLQRNPNLSSDDYLGTRAAVLRMIDPGAMGRFRVLLLDKDSGAKRVPVGLTSSRF